MTMNGEHVEFDVLNDYIDRRLSDSQTTAISAHLSSCEACRAEHDDLQALVRMAESAPKSLLPPDDIWGDIRSEIERGKEVVLQPSGGSGQRQRTGWLSAQPRWANRAILAAAAVLLVVGSSGITAIVLRYSDWSTVGAQTDIARAPGDELGASGQTRVLPARFRHTETEYLRTIDELRVALRAQRSVLKPETVRAVEHSLSIVDAAIDEARAALLSDPSNQTLVDLLTASYERKLDLLRRAADLDART